MKVELHLHTNRYSTCALNSPREMMACLLEQGYDAVYITEHNTVWPDDELGDLRSEFPSLRIFPGVELATGSMQSQHIVVLGTNDPAYVELTHAADVIAKASDDGHLAILAHPFRFAGGAEMLDQKLLPSAIEFYTCNHSPEFALRSMIIAGQLDLPLVNTGDVHALDMIGRFWIETNRPINQADDIAQIIATQAYKNCVHTS